MPSLASFSDPRAYHILSYSTLLGSNILNTFFSGPIAYTCLPRPQFATLQQKIFPPFFALQTAIPIVLALTWPGSKLVNGSNLQLASKDAGWRGLLTDANFWTALVPIATMFGTSLLNLLVLGPATTKVMKQRKHQETRDGKRYYEPGPKSTEMDRLNKSFNWLHGASSLADLVGLAAKVYYGIALAERL